MIGLHNPKNGAPIQDVVISFWKYHPSSEGAIFKPGESFKYEDGVAIEMLKLYGFLTKVSGKGVDQLPEPARVRPSQQEAPMFKTPAADSLPQNQARAQQLSKEQVQGIIEEEVPDSYGPGIEKDIP